MRSERRTRVWVFATAAAAVTGPMRSTIPTEDSGSRTGSSSRGKVWARNVLVPSAVSSSIRARWLDAGMPVTTTMVAMPSEIPSAESAARIRRVRSPSMPSPNRSATDSLAGFGRSVVDARSRRRTRSSRTSVAVSATTRPSRISTRRGSLAAISRSCVITAMVVPVPVQCHQQVEDRAPVRGVQRAGRLVGQHQRRSVDHGAGDGDALAFAAGELVGQVVGSMAEPDPFQRRDGQPRDADACGTPA